MADCRPSNNRLMTREELAPWIMRRLGAPVWKIEVCEGHITDAIEQAVRWFSAKKGVQKLFTMQMFSSQVEYDLDCEIDRVLDVVPTVQKMDLSLIFSPFTLLEEKIPYDVFASGGSGGLYSSYVQALQYIETAKRILSADFEWYQINQKLFIAPAPASSRNMIVWAKINFTRIEDLTERDHELVKRYALAMAMKDLAWIRGKYADYPSAQGTLTMNWDRLLDSADTELEKLNEEIMDSAGPMGMITG
jgi:hypothetical protein